MEQNREISLGQKDKLSTPVENVRQKLIIYFILSDECSLSPPGVFSLPFFFKNHPLLNKFHRVLRLIYTFLLHCQGAT